MLNIKLSLFYCYSKLKKYIYLYKNLKGCYRFSALSNFHKLLLVRLLLKPYCLKYWESNLHVVRKQKSHFLPYYIPFSYYISFQNYYNLAHNLYLLKTICVTIVVMVSLYSVYFCFLLLQTVVIPSCSRDNEIYVIY